MALVLHASNSAKHQFDTAVRKLEELTRRLTTSRTIALSSDTNTEYDYYDATTAHIPVNVCTWYTPAGASTENIITGLKNFTTAPYGSIFHIVYPGDIKTCLNSIETTIANFKDHRLANTIFICVETATDLSIIQTNNKVHNEVKGWYVTRSSADATLQASKFSFGICDVAVPLVAILAWKFSSEYFNHCGPTHNTAETPEEDEFTGFADDLDGNEPYIQCFDVPGLYSSVFEMINRSKFTTNPYTGLKILETVSKGMLAVSAVKGFKKWGWGVSVEEDTVVIDTAEETKTTSERVEKDGNRLELTIMNKFIEKIKVPMNVLSKMWNEHQITLGEVCMFASIAKAASEDLTAAGLLVVLQTAVHEVGYDKLSSTVMDTPVADALSAFSYIGKLVLNDSKCVNPLANAVKNIIYGNDVDELGIVHKTDISEADYDRFKTEWDSLLKSSVEGAVDATAGTTYRVGNPTICENIVKILAENLNKFFTPSQNASNEITTQFKALYNVHGCSNAVETIFSVVAANAEQSDSEISTKFVKIVFNGLCSVKDTLIDSNAGDVDVLNMLGSHEYSAYLTLKVVTGVCRLVKKIVDTGWIARQTLPLKVVN